MNKFGITKKIIRSIIQGIGLIAILAIIFVATASLIYIIIFRLEARSYSKKVKVIFEQSDLLGKDIQVALNHLPWPNKIETRRSLKIDKITGKITERGNYYSALIYYTNSDFFRQSGFYIGRGCKILYDQNTNKITDIH